MKVFGLNTFWIVEQNVNESVLNLIWTLFRDQTLQTHCYVTTLEEHIVGWNHVWVAPHSIWSALASSHWFYSSSAWFGASLIPQQTKPEAFSRPCSGGSHLPMIQPSLSPTNTKYKKYAKQVGNKQHEAIPPDLTSKDSRISKGGIFLTKFHFRSTMCFWSAWDNAFLLITMGRQL